MGKRTIDLTDELYDYSLSVSLRDSDVLARLRDETNRLEYGVMQISADQGQFMGMLVKILDAKRIIEVGTFTGYSALVMAQSMAAEGQIVACDVNEEWTTIARRYWEEAGVSSKICLHLAPAIETLKTLVAAGESNQFDMAFIDADKQNYKSYYEACLTLMRPGGVILVDNVFWGGSVADKTVNDPDTVAIREFNAYLRDDQRVDISMLPLGDGVTLARKR